ncbi:MAG: DUF1801 domain-containing protein [Planctomycetes bacterium]|nr:DUF1801 domain-containing protein [Planctomycetota bacterium]
MDTPPRLSCAELADYLAACPSEVCDLVIAVRGVVLKAAPVAAEAIKFHSLCYFKAGSPYGAIGGNICTIDGRSGVVMLGFIQGATLPDPKKLLKGDRKAARHVEIRSARQARDKAIRALIRASVAQCPTPQAEKASREPSRKSIRKSSRKP